MNPNSEISIHLNDLLTLSLYRLMECNGSLVFLTIGSKYSSLFYCYPGWVELFILLFMEIYFKQQLPLFIR